MANDSDISGSKTKRKRKDLILGDGDLVQKQKKKKKVKKEGVEGVWVRRNKAGETERGESGKG